METVGQGNSSIWGDVVIVASTYTRLAQLVAAVLLQSTGRKFEPYTEYQTFSRGCDLRYK